MKKQENKKIFDLKEVGFTGLEGQFVKIEFEQKDFANALFANAQSIDMDDFAREIHKNGKAELNDQVIAELPAIASAIGYRHRVVEAIKETLNKK